MRLQKLEARSQIAANAIVGRLEVAQKSRNDTFLLLKGETQGSDEAGYPFTRGVLRIQDISNSRLQITIPKVKSMAELYEWARENGHCPDGDVADMNLSGKQRRQRCLMAGFADLPPIPDDPVTGAKNPARRLTIENRAGNWLKISTVKVGAKEISPLLEAVLSALDSGISMSVDKDVHENFVLE